MSSASLIDEAWASRGGVLVIRSEDRGGLTPRTWHLASVGAEPNDIVAGELTGWPRVRCNGAGLDAASAAWERAAD